MGTNRENILKPNLLISYGTTRTALILAIEKDTPLEAIVNLLVYYWSLPAWEGEHSVSYDLQEAPDSPSIDLTRTLADIDLPTNSKLELVTVDGRIVFTHVTIKIPVFDVNHPDSANPPMSVVTLLEAVTTNELEDVLETVWTLPNCIGDEFFHYRLQLSDGTALSDQLLSELEIAPDNSLTLQRRKGFKLFEAGPGPVLNSIRQDSNTTTQTLYDLGEDITSDIEIIEPEQPSGKIFISYRRRQNDTAVDLIYLQLRQRFGEDMVFRDIHSLAPGSKWEQGLEIALRQSYVLLAVIGPEWLDVRDEVGRRRIDDPGDFVRMEIVTAIHLNKPVIPVLVEGATFPTKGALPPEMSALLDYQGIHIRSGIDLEGDIARLIKALENYVRHT